MFVMDYHDNSTKHLPPSGGRPLQEEYGVYDNMSPVSAVATSTGLTVAIYMTKPPSRGGRENQEIHLVKLEEAPEDMHKVYVGRS